MPFDVIQDRLVQSVKENKTVESRLEMERLISYIRDPATVIQDAKRLVALADFLSRHDQDELAEKLYLALYEHTFKQLNDADQLIVEQELGNFFLYKNEYERAEPLLQNVLKRVSQLYGEDSMEAAEAMLQLACLMDRRKDDFSYFSKKIMPISLEMLSPSSGDQGNFDPDDAVDLNALLSQLSHPQVENKIRDYYEKVLDIFEPLYQNLWVMFGSGKSPSV